MKAQLKKKPANGIKPTGNGTKLDTPNGKRKLNKITPQLNEEIQSDSDDELKKYFDF